MVPRPAPVLEPPITIVPGGFPETNAKLWGIGTAGNAPKWMRPRLNPKVATFKTAVEKTCVSWELNNWLRRGSGLKKFGAGEGASFSPSRSEERGVGKESGETGGGAS